MESGTERRPELAAEIAGERLRGRLSGHRFGDVEWVARTGSTNTDLADFVTSAGSGPPDRVLITDEQVQGRGRRNRTWVAPPGSGLLMSFLIAGQPRPAQPFWSMGAVAVATCDAVAGLPGMTASVGIKWPNDLLIGGAKTAGILAQMVADAIIVGIGINVFWSPEADEVAAMGSTSVQDHCTESVDRLDLAQSLIEGAATWLAADPDDLRQAWSQRCVTLGQPVRIETAAGPDHHGVAVAVDGDGSLVLEADGRRSTHHIGDVVHLRPEAGRGGPV